MANIQRIKAALKACRFEQLFLDELGWENLRRSGLQSIPLRDQEYLFTPLAHKSDFKVYLHQFAGSLPAESLLKQLDRKLELYAEEHLTLFVDGREENQVWMWTKKRWIVPHAPLRTRYARARAAKRSRANWTRSPSACKKKKTIP